MKLKNTEALDTLVARVLEDMKGQNARFIDVKDKTSITDRMVIVSGTSRRHIKTMADGLGREAKLAGYSVLGIEGQSDSEWVLIDLGDTIVHLMLPATRDFYNLEKLWTVDYKITDTVTSHTG